MAKGSNGDLHHAIDLDLDIGVRKRSESREGSVEEVAMNGIIVNGEELLRKKTMR